MTEADDAFRIAYSPDIGPRRRVRYQPTDNGWVRISERREGSAWHMEGRELVDGVAVELSTDSQGVEP